MPGGVARSRKRDEGASPIRSVERAALILELFTPTRPSWSLSDITSALSASRATIHRYVVALRRADLLRYNAAAGVYTLGPQILRLGAAALAGLPVVRVAGPAMQGLVREIDETVVLSVWDGDNAVTVRVEDLTDRLVQIRIRTGARLPAETSAQGRCFLAFLPPGERPEVPRSLESRLEEIRSLGVSIGSEVTAGIRAVAAPVFRGDEIVASVAVVGTAVSIPDDPDSHVVTMLRAAAKQISEELGATNGSANEEI